MVRWPAAGGGGWCDRGDHGDRVTGVCSVVGYVHHPGQDPGHGVSQLTCAWTAEHTCMRTAEEMLIAASHVHYVCVWCVLNVWALYDGFFDLLLETVPVTTPTANAVAVILPLASGIVAENVHWILVPEMLPFTLFAFN